jgi:DNA-binding transcriptional ArsR family regulator
VLELSFTTRDLAYVRFAFSPLWEVVASLRVLRDPAPDPIHHPWLAQVRKRLPRAGMDLRPLYELVPSPAPASSGGVTVIPGFLAPPPTTPMPDLEVELAVLAATPPDLTGPVAPKLDTLVMLIRRYWDLAVAPYWPRMLTLLQGDVLYRARRLTEGGTARLFQDLDPKVTWDRDTLYVAQRFSRSVALRGRGLLLVPSVFAWPRIYTKVDPPWPPVLRYPPRGIGMLWTAPTPASGPGTALRAILGRSRALLLAELAAPASTTDLARRTGLTAGAVSQHLGALRAAGLVTGHRTGRFVLYARTSAAEALLTAAP